MGRGRSQAARVVRHMYLDAINLTNTVTDKLQQQRATYLLCGALVVTVLVVKRLIDTMTDQLEHQKKLATATHFCVGGQQKPTKGGIERSGRVDLACANSTGALENGNSTVYHY